MPNLNEFTYGLIAIFITGKNVEIIHECLYKEKPSEVDKDSLKAELLTDPEFGLEHLDPQSIVIVEMPNERIEFLKKVVDEISPMISPEDRIFYLKPTYESKEKDIQTSINM